MIHTATYNIVMLHYSAAQYTAVYAFHVFTVKQSGKTLIAYRGADYGWNAHIGRLASYSLLLYDVQGRRLLALRYYRRYACRTSAASLPAN